MDFAFVDEDFVETEELSIDELASSVYEKETITDDSARTPKLTPVTHLIQVTSGHLLQPLTRCVCT